MIVFINSRVRFEFIKRVIKLSKRTILSFRIIVQILIIYFDKLLKNRDIFFKSQYLLFLKHIKKIYVHVINIFFRKI